MSREENPAQKVQSMIYVNILTILQGLWAVLSHPPWGLRWLTAPPLGKGITPAVIFTQKIPITGIFFPITGSLGGQGPPWGLGHPAPPLDWDAPWLYCMRICRQGKMADKNKTAAAVQWSWIPPCGLGDDQICWTCCRQTPSPVSLSAPAYSTAGGVTSNHCKTKSIQATIKLPNLPTVSSMGR